MKDKKSELAAKQEFTFDDLKEILRILRAPGGCPWDRAQTHESIRQNAVEEAYELADAIDRRDSDNMQEELGDCLLQVFFHIEISREKGEFDYAGVLNRLCKKLISRHTHIFGGDTAMEAGQALAVWERNKAAEKGRGKTMPHVPQAMPALMRAYKVQKQAAKDGFDFESADSAIDKIKEEVRELQAEIKCGNRENAEEELGDLLFSAVNVCRLLETEPETALNKANGKFLRRVDFVNRKIAEKGKTCRQADSAEIDKLWRLAKENDKV